MNKGFSLVELLAVIIILGIIAAITIPNINNSIEASRNSMYEEQIKEIENLANTWGINHADLLPSTGTMYISLQTLKEAELLENKKISDPRTNEELTGCVAVTFDNAYNQYTYTYGNTCE